jgi:hypothetical protein
MAKVCKDPMVRTCRTAWTRSPSVARRRMDDACTMERSIHSDVHVHSRGQWCMQDHCLH